MIYTPVWLPQKDDSVEEIVKSLNRGKGEEKETHCCGIVGDAVEHAYGS